MKFTPLFALPRDPQLPHLVTMVDQESMCRAFAQALLGAPVQHCEILWSKYKPGQNCTVCYRIALGERGEQLLYGRIYADGDGQTRYRKALAESSAQPKVGAPVLYLSKLGMVVWMFPNDRKMRGLAALLDRSSLQEVLLPEAICDGLGAVWQLDRFDDQLIHYVPEHTCTIKVEASAKQPSTGAERSLMLYGKTYYNRAGENTYANMRSLWQQGQTNAADLVTAQPWSYNPRHRVLWQTQVAGTTLLDLGIGTTIFQAAMPQAARAVAALHQAAIPSAQSQTLAEQVQRLTQVGELLARVMPENGAALDSLVERLVRAAPATATSPTATLHGDLHLSNILIDGERAALIDLDGLGRGPALCDVASLAAALIYHSLLHGLTPTSAWSLIESFVGHYQRSVPWAVPDDELRWHVAVALIVERAVRCVSRLKLGRIELVNELFEEADRLSSGQAGMAAA